MDTLEVIEYRKEVSELIRNLLTYRYDDNGKCIPGFTLTRLASELGMTVTQLSRCKNMVSSMSALNYRKLIKL